jgi:hypothetical protein
MTNNEALLDSLPEPPTCRQCGNSCAVGAEACGDCIAELMPAVGSVVRYQRAPRTADRIIYTSTVVAIRCDECGPTVFHARTKRGALHHVPVDCLLTEGK